MNIAPELDKMLLFLLLVFPGLVSMHVYRLLMPAKEIEWKTALIEALFYGTLNFGLCLPIIVPIHRGKFPDNHFGLYILLLVVVLIVTPVLWPVLLRFLLKCKWLMAKLQLPYPTAWDYFFDTRKPYHILVHLKNGHLIGGYYGTNSYATSFPREGDLYLEKVIRVDSQGKFIEEIKDSEGTLINRDAYDYIELFV